jgi:poly-gamma-glutamate synthesis protein (capsule biosynthesis protein)
MPEHAHRRALRLGLAAAAGAALWVAGCGPGTGPAGEAGGAAPAGVWVAPEVPAPVRRALGDAVRARPRALARAASAEEAAVRVGGPGAGGAPLAEAVLVPVVPFPTVADDVSWAAIRRFWRGDARPLAAQIGAGGGATLHVTAATRAMLRGLMGPPARRARIRTVAPRRLIDAAWEARPAAWSIVPFDRLRPRWKALSVDGRSALDRGLALRRYPLVARVRAHGPPAQIGALRRALARRGARTNRDLRRMTVLTMTGVTALSRTIAARMEANGVAYPAAEIGPVLRRHDLLHISNEVSFSDACPGPMPGTRFCSDPRYIRLLEDVGADIVELSGNHNLDWGPDAARATLRMYRARGWRWFAGGEDDVQARRPLLMAHNGNRLAFLGCNPVGPAYAWAGRGHPGAAACDRAAMERRVRRLRARGYLPVVTFQHWETYSYAPTGAQVADFGAVARAGAAIVSGSQAHQPQGFAFERGRLVHYGLGNLFFDQMQTLGTRQGIVDRHVLYDGRHLSTQLVTVLLEDYSQPRPTTPAERSQLLGSVFAASGW